MEPCWHSWPAPVLPSTFPSLPKDKQDGWCSLLRGDASFSSYPPNLLIILVIHMTEEQPSEFWQQLLHSSLHPWMGSVISRRGAWGLLGQRRWEAGGSRKSPLCHVHAGMDLSHAGQYHRGCLTMEVSLAVLYSAQHQENSREEGGRKLQGDFFPTLEGTHGHIPRGGCAEGCLRGTHGSWECPGEGHDK